ncbi:hypothetical protein [Leucothrix pacifica]|uniref:Uncharacterized protein n=1 Tax=Leucothrix pacifica TaxID=1247513 RepID=A0A317CI68_9GAMM|nr:hypothetical protein [Leucothrix pacifica]PWQ98196.1 hypothetical protein DKW60_08175 [Leucothrix pacifica]
MDIAAKKALLSQVRVGHRLLASYYQRIHLLLSDMSHDERLELEYFSWEPKVYHRPAPRLSNVLDCWAWDLLPGVATSYFFLHGSEKKAQRPGDWLLVIDVVTDTAVEDEESESALDFAVSAEEAQSVVRCHLVAPHKKSKVDWFHSVWGEVDWPECTDTPVLKSIDDNKQFYGVGFEIPMEELMGEDSVEILVDKIITFRDAVLPKSK